jgi:hypothetical protein
MQLKLVSRKKTGSVYAREEYSQEAVYLESTQIESSSSHVSSSNGSGGSGKRQRVESSPLQNQYLFDNQKIVDNMAIKEREFELERKRMELDMTMKEREEALQLQRVLVESAKAQTELMREYISRLK